MPKKMPNQIFVGMFIQQKRSELNYTQEYLAKLIGVSKTAVSNWENGVSMVDVKYLIPLTNVFGINVDELLFPTFQLEKNEFCYYTELFKQMLSDDLVDEGVCNKLIELYIQSKIEVSKLIKEYFLTGEETFIEMIQHTNKFGLAFYVPRCSIDKSYMKEILNIINEEKVDLNEIHIGDYIDTCWSEYEYDVDGSIRKEKDSIFYTIFNMLYEKSEETIDEMQEKAYYHFIVDRAILLEQIINKCSKRLVIKYIKTFSQEYRNDLITNLYKLQKKKIDSKAKKILQILLSAGCKYIKDGEDLTHLVYEKCL